jgi:cytochrome P450
MWPSESSEKKELADSDTSQSLRASDTRLARYVSTVAMHAAVSLPTCLGAYAATAEGARRLRRHRRLRHRGVTSETSAKLNFDLDLGQVLGTVKRNEGLYDNLPPGRVGLFGLRETFEYLNDPNKFIRTRVEKYGPVFKTAFFFKPAVVFGSAEAIREFKEFEGDLPADAALPETFRELHTEYGALRMSGERHKATRANFGKVLGRAALTSYTPILSKLTRDFVTGDLLEKGTIQPGFDCRQFCLKALFQLFLGTVPPQETMEKMYFYNEGLLALGKISPEFTAGQKALEELQEYCLKHYRTVRAQGKLDEPQYTFLKAYSEATDENGELFTDERVATTCVLMIWGAFIEAAASMGHTMWLLMRNPEKAKKVRAECRSSFTSEELKNGELSLDAVFTKLAYTDCAIKEALRVMPQTAGGLRVNPETRELAGYTVPAGYTLTADPRIAFLNPDSFPDPEEYRPERFEEPVSGDVYFPGGIGQHRCPGISLSNLMTSLFLLYMTSVYDSWSPDMDADEMDAEDPQYIKVPIVIIDDRYQLKLDTNWQYEQV